MIRNGVRGQHVPRKEGPELDGGAEEELAHRFKLRPTGGSQKSQRTGETKKTKKKKKN